MAGNGKISSTINKRLMKKKKIIIQSLLSEHNNHGYEKKNLTAVQLNQLQSTFLSWLQ